MDETEARGPLAQGSAAGRPLRQWDIFRRLDKLNLPPAVRDEIKRDAEWKEAAQVDFADALANCAAIELNKWQVSSENAHCFDLGLAAGELVNEAWWGLPLDESRCVANGRQAGRRC